MEFSLKSNKSTNLLCILTHNAGLKQAEEENRILRKLLSNKEIELEVQRELLKKKFGTSDPRKI